MNFDQLLGTARTSRWSKLFFAVFNFFVVFRHFLVIFPRTKKHLKKQCLRRKWLFRSENYNAVAVFSQKMAARPQVQKKNYVQIFVCNYLNHIIEVFNLLASFRCLLVGAKFNIFIFLAFCPLPFDSGFHRGFTTKWTLPVLGYF